MLHYADKRLKATEEELGRRIQVCLIFLLQGMVPYLSILRSLQTIPGIDEMGAAMLLVEIGDDMGAFGMPAKLASWAGMCPGNNESAGKKKSGKARKGNPYVRRILCEAANAASKTRCRLSDKFKGLMIR